MFVFQSIAQKVREPDLISDLKDLKNDLASKKIDIFEHQGNVQVRLVEWIRDKNPQIAKELEERDVEDFKKTKYISGRTYQLASFYIELRKMGMEDKDAKWWTSLFLERPESGFFSSQKSPLETKYFTSQNMMKAYKFFKKMNGIQKKNPKFLKTISKDERQDWQLLINRKKEYEKDNGSTGKNAMNWLMEQNLELRDLSQAGFSDFSEADLRVYKILKKEGVRDL